ncbi:MAG TPA: EamA family transporter, partial [Candidatus Wirthbacteria bacterium]|nr:EamA family transporter [Candidatus Wirthbacteria bacterium]
MSGIVAAIYASFFLAIHQVALKKSYRDFDSSIGFLFEACFGILLWIPLGFMFGGTLNDFCKVLPYAVVSAILSEALPFYALTKGQLSITSILIQTYCVYTIIFSFLINHESLSTMQLVLVGVIIIGSLLSSLPSKLDKRELIKSGAVFWPLLAAISIGFSDAWSKKVINQTSSFSFLIAIAMVQIPVALMYLRIEKHKISAIITDFR